MLWTLLLSLFVLWLLGLVGHIGAGPVHFLLVAVVVVFLIELLGSRRVA